jgi:methyl-accepting chemotaxis protein
MNWSLGAINDSSLYYFSVDSSYTKDEIMLVHLANIWTHVHRDLDFLIHDDIITDSSYRSYEEVSFLDENNNEITRLHPIERRKNTFTKIARVKIEASFLRIEKIKIIILRLSDKYDNNLQYSSKLFENSLFLFIIFNFIVLFISFSLLYKKILQPITYINIKLNEFNQGEFKGKIKVSVKNELGKIQIGINKLVNNFLIANEFIKNIRDKKVTTFNQLKDSKNPLLNSLREMSNELKKAETEEKERNWIIEGQAEFSELLSKHTNNFQNLVDAIISNLVKYIEGLQGAIFIVNEDDNVLDLVSSFAYDRKKFITKRVELGEGLVGQAWHEEKYIQLDDIPEEHTKIKSGMGQATPKNILIVPLIDNQRVYGIIELASFKTIQDFQKEFVLRISENIAATLSSVEVNNKTQKLLSESQLLTEKMKEQEEEMMQNLEELQATQDDITRKEFQKEQELKGLNEKLHESNAQFERKEHSLNDKIKNLETLLEESKEDNEKIRELETNINNLKEELEATTIDLKETIRMKDLKIQKMRKKMSTSNDN